MTLKGVPFRKLWMSAVEGMIITIIAFGIAIGFNALRKKGIPLIRKTPFSVYTLCPELGTNLPEITIDKLKMGEKRLYYVDSRLSNEYCSEHIPGAHFMPVYPIDMPDFKPLQNLPEGSWIIVYGQETVKSDERMVTELVKLKLRGVYILKGGLKAWKDAKRPVSKLEIAKVNEVPTKALFVDASSEELFTKDHAAGAVNIPPEADLPPEMEKLSQVSKYDGIIAVYSQGDDSAAAKTACELSARGIKNVKVVTGGIDALRKKGVKIESGK